jgi:hypothetical protein
VPRGDAGAAGHDAFSLANAQAARPRSSAPEAASWLVQTLGVDAPSPATLQDALVELRRFLEL